MSIDNLLRVSQWPVEPSLDNVDVVLDSLKVDEFLLRKSQIGSMVMCGAGVPKSSIGPGEDNENRAFARSGPRHNGKVPTHLLVNRHRHLGGTDVLGSRGKVPAQTCRLKHRVSTLVK